MRRLLAIVAVPVALMAALWIPSAASAATEVGNICNADQSATDFTLVQVSKDPASPLPLTVPADGVVTSWKVQASGKAPVPTTEQLKVFRGTSSPLEYLVVGESAPQTVIIGPNTFETRIPVRAGDRFGVHGASALHCVTNSEQDVLGFTVGNSGSGSTLQVADAEPKLQVGVAAVVEPDADADGFGDETQDRCPRSAAVQLACPAIGLSSHGILRKGSAQVFVAVSSPAEVSVAGALAGTKGKLGGGRKSVAPGKLVSFTIKFPPSLKTRLAELPRSQSLILRATASTADATGAISTSRLKLKLRGRAGAP
jgi:hypothetical protein